MSIGTRRGGAGGEAAHAGWMERMIYRMGCALYLPGATVMISFPDLKPRLMSRIQETWYSPCHCCASLLAVRSVKRAGRVAPSLEGPKPLLRYSGIYRLDLEAFERIITPM